MKSLINEFKDWLEISVMRGLAMKNFAKRGCIISFIFIASLNSQARFREDESVEVNLKRIIADHLKIGINDIKETSTLKDLGADDVDAVLIMTQAQYFFDISYDIKDSAKLGNKAIKVSEFIDKTTRKIYP